MKYPLLFINILLHTILQAQDFSEIVKVTASDRSTNAFYGRSVAISGDYAIVGAHFEQKDSAGGNALTNAGAAYILKRSGNDWLEIKKLTPSDRASSDLFGFSVSIFGDYAVVGALFEDEDALGGNTLSSAGAAYIFKKDYGGTDNWGEIRKITASDRETEDRFGKSVAIFDEYIVVGAPEENYIGAGGNFQNDAGAAYIFKKDFGGIDNWGEIRKIVSPHRSENDYFGNSVSISERYLVVGSHLEDEDTISGNIISGAGAAYIFDKNEGGTDNWGQTQMLVASDRAGFDEFGISVSISDNYIVVGAHEQDGDTISGNTIAGAGAAYIFKKNAAENWFEVKKIVSSDRDIGDRFGISVSISNDYVVVGAEGESYGNFSLSFQLNAGGAYIFKKDEGGMDNWGQIQKIVASDRSSFDYFGYIVSISEKYIIAGAYEEDSDASGNNFKSNSGSAYIFKGDFPISTVHVSSEQNEFKLYPNPAANKITINHSEQINYVDIYNSFGRKIKSIDIENNYTEIYLEEFPKGIYFFRFYTKSGDLFTKQLIKK